MRFVDLFAGLGGFHLALSQLGHQCVFASEIDAELAKVYSKNFGIRPAGDIRKIRLNQIPTHDILCAGIPCQPFSKAGGQQGLDCPLWGDLVNYVIQVLRYHKPIFFIIENVPNFVRHGNGKTWEIIRNELCSAGYDVEHNCFSPHQFGIPQLRHRTFIVGQRGTLNGFEWPIPTVNKVLSIHSVLDEEPPYSRVLSDQCMEYLTVWQKFIDLFPRKQEFPTFPIWAMEFGATYPYKTRTPYSTGYTNLERWRGSFGTPLRGLLSSQVTKTLPRYALDKVNTFPRWKIELIRKNRELYREYKEVIDSWLPEIRAFSPSFQKLEWNCKGGVRDIWRYVVQFRASGIRVRRPTFAPSLVAMTTSQVPVIGWERRYMTPRECSRLQSMGELKYLPRNDLDTYRALGNAVNVDVVNAISKNLLATRNVSCVPMSSSATPACTKTI